MLMHDFYQSKICYNKSDICKETHANVIEAEILNSSVKEKYVFIPQILQHTVAYLSILKPSTTTIYSVTIYGANMVF